MASPISHPFPQKYSAASYHTPASASSPPAPPSSHSGTNRSITSPAYSAALKAPNRPLHHRNGSAQLPPGSTPRAVPSNGTPQPGTTSATDSPAATAAAAMLMDGHFNFSATAGIGSGFTPRGVGLTPVAMQLTASQGGFSAIAAAQDQEEERKRRTEVIVSMMSTRWGFVSQEGVERCARRLGLECLWEEGMGDGQRRKLIIAGNGVLIDVEFQGDEVLDVVLQFEGSRESVVVGAGAAAKVLRKNLRGIGNMGYVTLDGFVGNLERLGCMDQLGGAEINCFDTVDGIYRCLERVFAWEQEKLKQRGVGSTIEIICRQSGRPKMHTAGRVGALLEYWMDSRLLNLEETVAESIEIDESNASMRKNVEEPSAIWRITLECEASLAEIYPPIRLSDAWSSELVAKPELTDATALPPDDTSIDWQDPPPTLLPSKSGPNGNGTLEIDSALQSKPPDVRFVAKFEPPVNVPLQTAVQIHASAGLPLTQELLLPTTYESLVFADVDTQNPSPPGPRVVEKLVSTYKPNSNTSTSHKHRSTLYTQPNDYARAITQLPFSHPRQIVTLLPTLRKWALTASILRNSFIVDPTDEDGSTPTINEDSLPQAQSQARPTFQTIDEELADFMSSPSPNDPTASSSSAKDTKTIDINLTTTPLPHFNITFPNPRHGGKLASISFSIGLNGTIDGVDVDDGSPPWERDAGPSSIDNANAEGTDERGKEKVKLREKVKRVLEVGESIGACVEWMTGEKIKGR